MCFNKEVSLLMFIIGLATVIKLYIEGSKIPQKPMVSIEALTAHKDIILGTVILGITLMQLLEYFIFLNHSKTTTNLVLSFMIHMFILLHVVAFVSMSLYYNMFDSKENSNFYIPVLVFFSLFMFFFLAVTFTTNWSKAYTLKNSCRLSWGPYMDPNNKYLTWGMGLSYVAIFFMLFYVLMGYKGLAIIIPTCLFSYIFSRYFDKNGTMGSYWCFLVLILCILGGIFDFVP